MKKFVFTLMALLLLAGSLSALAAETSTPPTTSAPVTSVKPTDIKVTVTDTKNPNDTFVCPMMQGAGNVFFEKRVEPLGENSLPGNGKVFKFRFNNHQSNCCNRPRIFRWIGMGMKFIVCLLFWILLIVFMVVLIRWLLKPHHPHLSSCCQSHPHALHILQERYAKGEISSEQFEEMKAKLT